VRSSFSDKWFGEACFPLNQMTTGGNSRSARPGMLFTSRWFEDGFHSWLKSGLGWFAVISIPDWKRKSKKHRPVAERGIHFA